MIFEAFSGSNFWILDITIFVASTVSMVVKKRKENKKTRNRKKPSNHSRSHSLTHHFLSLSIQKSNDF
ncbi:hypothetical protein Hanom_Chr13g01234831 [Helianthus anomalus]